MRKIVIVCFLALLMLLAPLSSVAHNIETLEEENESESIELPEFYLSDEDQLKIKNYVNSNFFGEERIQANEIVDKIISSDGRINVIELFESLAIYGYPIIDESKLEAISNKEELNQLLDQYWGVKDGVLIDNIFGNLINKIIELIQNRLGWLHYFLDEGGNVFIQGVRLIVNLSHLPLAILKAFVGVVNLILLIPQYIVELVTSIFKLDFNEFVDTFVEIIEGFAGSIVNLINETLKLIQNEIIRNYLFRVKDFFGWLDTKPWQAPILIKGVVRVNGLLCKNADVEVKGVTSRTDNNGRYSFYVNPVPLDDSIPSGKYYGLHNCSITVSRNGEVLRVTPTVLSFVFSGGILTWPFLIIKNRSNANDKEYSISIFERINSLMERIYTFFYSILYKFNEIKSSFLFSNT